ncbi:MAG: SIMPL domain-containing protein [Nannocystaceae bacterium]|nr:SIMPL domain-containing protein [bacterium]
MPDSEQTDPHLRAPSSPRASSQLGKVLLPAAVVLSVSIAALSWRSVKADTHTIRVTGSATQRITSDLLEWDATIEHRASSRAEAYRKVRADVAEAAKYLADKGIDESEVRVSATEVSAVYRTEYEEVAGEAVSQSRLAGYVASQTITVTSRNVAKVEALSREITGLLDKNIPIESDAPRYHYTGLEDLKIEILAEASADARERAERILDAAGSGAKLGAIVDTHMGVININPANSTATSWEGMNDKTSLDKDIITVVHVTYEVD